MGILVASMSSIAREAGQAVVAFLSLESAARVGWILANPSQLTTIDRSTAGSNADWDSAGAQAFPFFFDLGAMASREDWRRR